MRCWNWQTTSRGPMALPLGSEGSCNALTTESPLCNQDRPMAAGQSPPGSSSCKTKAQKSSIGMGRSCCVKKAASLGEQKTAENYFKCFTTARALWKLYLLLLEWKTYFVAPKIFEHNFLYCSQLPLMLARDAEEILQEILDKPDDSCWETELMPGDHGEEFVLTQRQSFSSADPKVPRKVTPFCRGWETDPEMQRVTCRP